MSCFSSPHPLPPDDWGGREPSGQPHLCSLPAPAPRAQESHLWKEKEGEEVGHGHGSLRVFRANDGHDPGHVVAVVLLDGQEVVLLRQEVEHGLDVVGDVADVHHRVAQPHARQQAGVVVDLLHRKVHGLHELVAQRLHLVPGGPQRGGRQVQNERGGQGSQPAGPTRRRKAKQALPKKETLQKVPSFLPPQ